MYDSSDFFVLDSVICTPMRTLKDFWEQILVHEVMAVLSAIVWGGAAVDERVPA
jgi:hypothetical protein